MSAFDNMPILELDGELTGMEKEMSTLRALIQSDERAIRLAEEAKDRLPGLYARLNNLSAEHHRKSTKFYVMLRGEQVG